MELERLKENPWINQIKDIVKTTKSLSQLKRNAEQDRFNIQETAKLAEGFINREEKDHIFPALSALLHVIMYGTPLTRQQMEET